MKAFKLMITFLTRIPLKIDFDFEEEEFHKGIWYIPFIGMLIGVILYAIYSCTQFIFSPRMLGSILLIVYLGITGGLHIDGLADTFDAFGSNRSRERMLEIMKDSHIGTFGVLSIVLYCIMMISVLVEVPYLCLVFPVVGRSMSMLSCAMSNYGRKDGLGKAIIENTKISQVIFSICFVVFTILCLAWLKKNTLLFWVLFFAVLLTYGIGYILTKRSSKKLGGITGDIIGYIIEMSSVIFLVSSYIGIGIMERM